MTSKKEHPGKPADGQVKFRFGKNHIIYNTIYGEINKEIAEKIRLEQLDVLNKADKKYDSLIDLNHAGLPTTEARKIGREMFEHNKMGRVALFGVGQIAKMIGNFMIGITRKKEIRFFSDREKALVWLKKK